MSCSTKHDNVRKSTWFDKQGCKGTLITVDSGATEHAVKDLMYFEKVNKMESVNSLVADDSKAVTTHEEEVLVTETEQLILSRNVYCVI